jgi:hypothetical protein
MTHKIYIDPLPKGKYYVGRVIDGPLEGRWVESDEPWFQSLYKSPVPLEVWENKSIPTLGGFIHYVYYRWMPSYRAWAWIQPNVASNIAGAE